MMRRKLFLLLLTTALLIAPVVTFAQPSECEAQPYSTATVVSAPPRTLPDLLPDMLAGVKATGDVKQYSSETIAALVADKSAVYQEYRVRQAASREYGKLRVEIFETPSPLAAFGLFSYYAGENGAVEDTGSGGAMVSGALVFWKDNCFVRVTSLEPSQARAVSATLKSVARAEADLITASDTAAERPRLLDSLPAGFIAHSERYFLGPESLNAYLEHGRETFNFSGDAEAVMAEYKNGKAAAPVKLTIVEYHTPQLATEAMAAASAYVESLPDEQRNQSILKRVGNFIVEASGFEDRAFAQSLVDRVEYPYVVRYVYQEKPDDPLQGQKAAQLLISIFSLLGILLMAVLVLGSIFGSIIFLKRRRHQRQAFSDAGGMLRLEIDPFETVILGLPPKKED
ncbi:MAG TPA: DUF6599 family protein [Blastocatellia bacterium]|nr:DUF6599 family protein [Blastocatellia bacterium]